MCSFAGAGWGGGASPTEIGGEAETETKAVRYTRQGVSRVREQERRETGHGSRDRGHTDARKGEGRAEQVC